MTSDDDWSTLDQFQALLDGLAARQAHCTFYIVPGTHLTRDLMARWAEVGHTFSVHPALEQDFISDASARRGFSDASARRGFSDASARRGFSVASARRGLRRDLAYPPDVQRNTVAPMLRENVARHLRDFGGEVRTIRQHAVRWAGYVETARLLAELDVAMEANYVSVHPFPVGFMAGSGRPLPFVDLDGSLIALYQQPTMWTEEVLIHPSFVFSFKWSVAHALQEVQTSLERAAQAFYTPVTINSHPVSFATYSSPLIEGTWDRALALGMPVISPDEWLAWTQARRSVTLDLDDGGVTARATRPVDRLTVLLPAQMAAPGEPVHCWGKRYTAVTLRGLTPGREQRISAG
jgi:hypothetical protein